SRYCPPVRPHARNPRSATRTRSQLEWRPPLRRTLRPQTACEWSLVFLPCCSKVTLARRAGARCVSGLAPAFGCLVAFEVGAPSRPLPQRRQQIATLARRGP